MGVRIIDLEPDDQVGSIARVEAESSRPSKRSSAVLDLRLIASSPRWSSARSPARAAPSS